MYKKLLVAPLVLSLALSTVAPNFAQAVETGTTEEVQKEESTNGEAIGFKMLHNGKESTYGAMMGAVTQREVNGKYEIVMEVPKMLTEFTVKNFDATKSELYTVTTSDGKAVEVYAVTFTVDSLEDLVEVTLGYKLGTKESKYDVQLQFDAPEKEEVIETPNIVREAIGFKMLHDGKESTYGAMMGAVTQREVNGKYEIVMEVPKMLTEFTVKNFASTKSELYTVTTSDGKAVEVYAVTFTVDSLEDLVEVTLGYKLGTKESKYDVQLQFDAPEKEEVIENTNGNTNENTNGNTNENTDETITEEGKEMPLNFNLLYNGKISDYQKLFGSATSKAVNGKYEVTLQIPSMLTVFTVSGSSVTEIANSDNGTYKTVKFTIPSLTVVGIHIEYKVVGYVGNHDMALDFTGQNNSGNEANNSTGETKPSEEDKPGEEDKPSEEDKEELIQGDYTAETVLENAIGDVEQYVSTDQQPSVSVTEQGEYNVSLPITNMDNVQSVEVNGVSIYTKTVLQKLASFFKPLSTTQVIHFTTKKLAGNEIKITTTDGALHSAKLSFANATKLDKVEENPDVDGEQKEEPVKEEPVKEEPVKDKVIQTVKPSKVTVANKKGAVDTVTVYSTTKGQIVKLYNAKGKVIAKQTAKSKTTKFTKLNLGKNAGTIFVTLQKPKQLESKKLKVAFKKEPVSTNIKSTSITIKNYKSKSDVITISGTAKGEVIYIYNAKGKQLKKVKATSKKTTIKIAQLGKSSGSIKVARIQSNKHISSKTIKKFSKEK